MLVNQCVNVGAIELLTAIPAGSVGAVITDPPFFVNVGRAENWSKDCGMGADPWSEVSTVDEAIKWTIPHAQQMLRVLRPGGAAVVMGGSQSLAAWEVAASRVGLSWMAELTVLWNTGKPRARNFGSLTTSIRWYIKPGARHSFNSGEARAIFSNVIVCRKIPVEKREHPAQKPVELTTFLVSLLTNEGDMVVDPFAGAGSTLVSAALTDRRWLGSDLEAKYCGIAERRAKHADMEEDSPLYLWINNKLVPVAG